MSEMKIMKQERNNFRGEYLYAQADINFINQM